MFRGWETRLPASGGPPALASAAGGARGDSQAAKDCHPSQPNLSFSPRPIQDAELSTPARFVRRALGRLCRLVTRRRRTPQAPADATAQVSQFWAARAAETGDCPALPGIWTWHPVVRAGMNRRISGRGDMEWLAWVQAAFFPEPVGRALSLGCGGGQLEREAISLRLCRAVEGVDVSEGAVALARQRAADAGLPGITYRVADLNQVELPAGTYDLVMVKQSLHHVSRLEHVLDQVLRSLRPRGWLLVNEFVGPSRFQWTETQLSIINQLLPLLPERLRRVGGPQGAVRERVDPAPIEQLLAQDPSEAVRSSEILSLVEQRFEVLVRRDFGGTLLNPMLEGIAPNFSPESEEDTAILQLLILTEDLLIERKAIPSDFTLLVTRKPG